MIKFKVSKGDNSRQLQLSKMSSTTAVYEQVCIKALSTRNVGRLYEQKEQRRAAP